MDDYALDLGGKRYISSKRAAEITGYTKDYIGQLARGGKIDAKLVGRNWYIDENSVLEHKRSGGSRRGKAEIVKERAEREKRILNEEGISFEKDPMLNARFEKDETPLMPQVQKAESIQEKEETNGKVPEQAPATQPTVTDESHQETPTPAPITKVAINKTPKTHHDSAVPSPLDGITLDQTVGQKALVSQGANSNTPPAKAKTRYSKEVNPVLGALAVIVLIVLGLSTIMLEQGIHYSQERLELVGGTGTEFQYHIGDLSELILSASAKLSDL